MVLGSNPALTRRSEITGVVTSPAHAAKQILSFHEAGFLLSSAGEHFSKWLIPIDCGLLLGALAVLTTQSSNWRVGHDIESYTRIFH